MALTNNTKFRRKKLTINKKVNGSIDTAGGFPVQLNVTSAFPGYAALTDAEFKVMTDADYNTRLSAFYAYVQTLYPFFSTADVLNAASGTDSVLCPLDNTASPTPTVLNVDALMAPVGGSTTDNHLEWGITLSDAVTQDTPYYFDIDIKDKNFNFIRTETVFGIILSGQIGHYAGPGEVYYIAEADDLMVQPLNLTAKIETVQF